MGWEAGPRQQGIFLHPSNSKAGSLNSTHTAHTSHPPPQSDQGVQATVPQETDQVEMPPEFDLMQLDMTEYCYVWQWLNYLCYLAWVCLPVYCHIYLVNIIYIKCTAICNVHLQVPSLERDTVTNRYKIFTFITTIFFSPYNTINTIHKCTLNCKDFLIGYSSSNLYSLSNLV